MPTENASSKSPWKMSDQERDEYAQSRQAMAEASGRRAARGAAKDKPMSKAESAKIGKAMIQALAKCDQNLALSLLEAGGAPNSRDGTGRSALDLALELCGKGADMHDFCEALIERGGWVAPERYSSMASEFTEFAAKGKPLDGKLFDACMRLTRDLLFRNSAKWSLVKSAMARIAPRISEDEMLLDLGKAWRFGILRQAAADGARITPACMQAAASRLRWTDQYSGKPTMFNSAEGKEFAALLKEPSAIKALEGKAVSAFFCAAAWESDAGVLMALLDAGLRPGEHWMGSMEVKEGTGYHAKIVTVDAPLLVVAASSPAGRGAFEALKAFAPALEGAKANPPTPRVLADIPTQKLFDLRDAGVDIGSVDAVGTFAHWWARLDDKPRDGWAMMATKAPEIFDTPNGQGKRAAECMGEKMGPGKAKDEFLGALSRMEFREIRKEVVMPKKKAPVARNRL